MNVAAHDYAAAAAALGLVAFFFAGAFLSSSLIQANPKESPRPYAMALLGETGLLVIFMIAESNTHHIISPRLMDLKAAPLCLAMGMQNTLVTSISGVRVRTTHMTGVITDLAIEAARWFRWHRWRLLHNTGWPLIAGVRAEPPERAALLFHLTLLFGFLLGGIGGATAATLYQARAMCIPSIAAFAAGAYALFVGRRLQGSGEHPQPRPDGRHRS